MRLKSLVILFLILGCSVFAKLVHQRVEQSYYSPVLPEISDNYEELTIPNHLSKNYLLGPGQNSAVDNDNTPQNNPITNEGATLGRVLFYDKNLSFNRKISCASCHQQSLGFADSTALSIGFDGFSTRRNSMSLINARWYGRGKFFWDERAASLEEQVIMPMMDPTEMGMNIELVISRVSELPYYEPLFIKAFGSNEVTIERISMALAQFVRSIISVNSKYDIERQKVASPRRDFSGFTESENNGKRIFMLPKERGGAGCIGCHSTEAFINPDNGTTNNGLDEISQLDQGVYEHNPKSVFLGTFKVPSLKNVALTAPYMHDGRFTTLMQVVNHYDHGVKGHQNLGKALKDEFGNPQVLELSSTDKTDLVNFLLTLTDTVLAHDPKYSDPFKN